MPLAQRQTLAQSADKHLSQRDRCQLLGINRSTLFYQMKPSAADDIDVMNAIQEIYAGHPFMGYRRLTVMLTSRGYVINHKRTLRLMRFMGLQAVYARRNLSKRRLSDAVYPYLLIDQPAQVPGDVWAVDITYLRLAIGFVYLTALIDLISRQIMGWNISTCLETDSCLRALDMALALYPKPDIINSDQGCQFTSIAWTKTLTAHGIKISMDGKGRYLDNIYIERFWKSLKYEEVYLKSYDTVEQCCHEVGLYIQWYNTKRPHQSLGYQTPQTIYQQFMKEKTDDMKKICTMINATQTDLNQVSYRAKSPQL